MLYKVSLSFMQRRAFEPLRTYTFFLYISNFGHLTWPSESFVRNKSGGRSHYFCAAVTTLPSICLVPAHIIAARPTRMYILDFHPLILKTHYHTYNFWPYLYGEQVWHVFIPFRRGESWSNNKNRVSCLAVVNKGRTLVASCIPWLISIMRSLSLAV